MTLKEAYEVKEITDACISTIPATHVDRIFYYYQTYIDPTTKNKPCTCTGKYWTGFLHALKDKVTDVINSHTANLEDLSKEA
jgi:hypothetical protein